MAGVRLDVAAAATTTREMMLQRSGIEVRCDGAGLEQQQQVFPRGQFHSTGERNPRAQQQPLQQERSNPRNTNACCRALAP